MVGDYIFHRYKCLILEIIEDLPDMRQVCGGIDSDPDIRANNKTRWTAAPEP